MGLSQIPGGRVVNLIFKSVGLVVAAAFSAGCATTSSRSARPETAQDLRSLHDVLVQDVNDPRISGGSRSTDHGELVLKGVRLKNTHFDIPVTINSRVEQWVDYFTGKGRPHFTRYLERSEYFIPYIAPLLKQNGMPEDLVYLAMIESGFNNHAKSHARAVGPWQFMAATGKRYGLSVNWWVDERRDIHKSTMAAVGYLRDLYLIFGSWELAAAAYNSGESKIARGVRRYATKDFWVLSRHRFLRPETRDYVPKMIAAALLAKNREQFGFAPKKPSLGTDEAVAPDGELVKLIQSDRPTESDAETERLDAVADASDADADSDVTEKQGESDTAPATLTVPAGSEPKSLPGDGKTAQREETTKTVAAMPMARPVPTPHVSKSGKVGGEELLEFEVQSPADLLKVSRAAGLSYQTVKSLNPELVRWCTPPSESTYRIKLPAFVRERFISTYNHAAFPRKVQFMVQKARRGDTLQKIARHFGLKVDPMRDLNRVSPQAPLAAGSKILLPMPNDRSRTMASLEVRDPPEKRRARKRRSNRAYKVNYESRGAARRAASSGT